MSLAVSAARGAIWVIASNVGARVVGLVSTLVVLRFISPADYGAVSVAAVIAISADSFTAFGIFRYLMVNPKAPQTIIFHSFFFHILIGLTSLSVAFATRHYWAGLSNAPLAASYIPGMVLAITFLRLGFPAEQLLARELRFRTAGIARGLTEVIYSGTAVLLAVLGFGGYAIVYGNIVQRLVWMLMLWWVADVKQLVKPSKLSWQQTKTIFGFGIPVGIADASHIAAGTIDRVLISRFFGPAVAGRYNLAYNLADIPAMHVGEHIGDVLLPSFARMESDDRVAGLIRATRLLALVIFPLAVGLGAVAETVTLTVFDDRWGAMAPMLLLLSSLSVVRPVGWTVSSFQVASQRPRIAMYLEVTKVIALLTALYITAHFGILWACFGVGLAFTTHAVGAVLSAKFTDDVPFWRLAGGLVPQLIACLPMVGAVFGVRYGLRHFGFGANAFTLAAEIIAGAMVYVPAAFIFAPTSTKDFISVLRRVIASRRGGGEEEQEEGS